MEEIWKDIKGFEGLYQVSNLGRVRSITRTVTDKNGRRMRYKGKNISPSISKKGGYFRIVLSKDGHSYPQRVHRLVAETFVSNPYNLPCVNHKDEDTSNNAASNLEWCSWKYNDNYGTHSSNISTSHQKPVAQFTVSGKLIRVFESAGQAEKETGIGASQIRAVALGKLRYHHGRRQPFITAGGYKWRYIKKGK